MSEKQSVQNGKTTPHTFHAPQADDFRETLIKLEWWCPTQSNLFQYLYPIPMLPWTGALHRAPQRLSIIRKKSTLNGFLGIGVLPVPRVLLTANPNFIRWGRHSKAWICPTVKRGLLLPTGRQWILRHFSRTIPPKIKTPHLNRRKTDGHHSG